MAFKRIILAAALAGAAFASPASASVTITGISGNPGFLTGRVNYSPGGLGGVASRTSLDLYVGRMRLTGVDNSTMAAVSFDTYCIDIFHFIQSGTFDIQAFTLGNAIKDTQVKKLLSHTAGFIDGAASATDKKNISAAIQMAVWEIVNEGGTSGYSLDTGLFQMGTSYGTVNPTARTLAQSYLDSLAGWAMAPGYSYKMMTAINPQNNQRQVFLAAAAVPEPSTWALLIAGFGMVGGAMRRRRRRASIAFA